MKKLRLSYLSLLLLLGPLLSYGQCSNQITILSGGTALATVNNGQSGGAYSVCPTAGAQYKFDGSSSSIASLTWYQVTPASGTTPEVATIIATTGSTNVPAGTVLSISVAPTVATTYRFESNSNSCKKDGFANFTFTPSLSLTTDAANLAGICAGNAVTLTANGSSTNTYSWTANGVTIPNQTGATLTQNPLVTTVYTVTATTSCGTSSQQLTIPVNNVTISPSAPIICAGASTSLTATYSGSSATYVWSIKGQSGTISPTSTTATSSTISVAPTATTTYQAVATTGDCSPITKEVTVTVSVSPTTVGVSPASSTLCTGATTTLTATSNYTNATYAWRLNGTPIAGATGSTYTATAPAIGAINTYSVTATTTCGGTSSAATATVSAASPTYSISPSGTVCSGSSTTLTASTNITNATYAWYTGPANGTAINTGTVISTSSSITVMPVVTASTTYPYQVVITTACGNSTQNVTVTAIPSVSVTPTSTRISSGNTTTLTASGASGYTWTYVDNNGTTGTLSGTSSTQTVMPTVTTTYTATGTPAITVTGSCSNSAQAVVTVVGALPVKLVSFDARWTGGNLLLAWTTASEANSAYYIVERSLDGTNFMEIGQVAAQGTKLTTTVYSYRDIAATPKAGIYYYRLRQVDLDGKEAYSPVRTVTGTGTTSLSLYPNPSGTRTNLVGAVAGASVQVMDVLGRVVYTDTADATGAAALTLPDNTPKGLYLVRTGNQTIRLTVIE